MEHIVQFGITIDDNAIKKNIEKNAQNQLVNIIKQDIMKELVGNKQVSSWEYTAKIKELVTNIANDFLELHKDEIVDATSTKLVEKLAKTKAVKEMVSSILDELMNK